MTDHHVRLVAGLTPPQGVRYHANSPVPGRNRFVLYALAYLADEHGKCTISHSDLAAYTEYNSKLIHQALHALRDAGLITITIHHSGPNTYRVLADELEHRQLHAVLRRKQDILVLEMYGAPRHAIRILRDKRQLTTIPQLAEEIAAYRERAAQDVTYSFHSYLDERGLGDAGAQRILDAFDAYRADPETPEPGMSTAEQPPRSEP